MIVGLDIHKALAKSGILLGDGVQFHPHGLVGARKLELSWGWGERMEANLLELRSLKHSGAQVHSANISESLKVCVCVGSLERF